MKTIATSQKESLSDSKIFKLIIVLIFIAGSLWSAPNKKPVIKTNDSLVCLQIQGKILIFGESDNDNDCIIELIDKYGNTDTLMLKDNKRSFKFMLERNSSYAIRVSKKGYVTKYVSVNTDMADGGDDVIHRFAFETPLLKNDALVHLNKEAADLPIAIIHFDDKKHCFNYDKEYTANIKKQLRKEKPMDKTNSINTNSRHLASVYSN